MTEQEIRERLAAAIVAAGGQRKFAEQHRFTVGYINDVVHGRRAFADRVLAAIGLVRKIVYEETPHEQ